MRHFLLSWYGITDLRAALGFEATDGPILSALKTGVYTDAIILAYTNPAKEQQALTDQTIIGLEGLLASNGSTSGPNVGTSKMYVDLASNTEASHALFSKWLNKRLTAAGLSVSVTLLPYALKQLNDARGIYAAASSAIKQALRTDGEKKLTVYVSPGTPVMAYTWALIARSNPQLSIDVIASSEPEKPPEVVELPKELIKPSIRPASPQSDGRNFDVVIHLLGEQKMPIFFGIRQFNAKDNIFITTKEYQADARRLAKILNTSTDPMVIKDPFKPAETRKAIEKIAQRFPENTNIAVNMTGGTKLMFAGALSACWENGLEPFYFEIRNHNVLFLRDGSSIPFIGINNVEDFIQIAGFKAQNPGRWQSVRNRDNRLDATKKLWDARSFIVRFYPPIELSKFIASSISKQSKGTVQEYKKQNTIVRRNENGSITIIHKYGTIDIPECKDMGIYISGGWLEEYVYSLLLPLEEQGLIRDLRIGMVLDYAGSDKSQLDTQEFDCAFTDGKRLWIVECKAGAVKQEHLQKLENNLKLYGGVAARGILVSANRITESHLKRIENMEAVTAIAEGKLSTESLKSVIASA